MEKDGLCLKNSKGMEGWNPGMLDSGAWGYIYIWGKPRYLLGFPQWSLRLLQVVQTSRSVCSTLGRGTLRSLPFDIFTCSTSSPYLCSIWHLCKADGFTLCLPMFGPFPGDQWGPASRCCGQEGVHLLRPGGQSSLKQFLKQCPGWFWSGGWTHCVPMRPYGRYGKLECAFPGVGWGAREAVGAQSSSLFSSLLWDMNPFGSRNVV